ncbi:hypothetical protein JXB02_01635 [Candidatus Woesearchaeota archaeon]|nr:hypothetical protein [Candidatus Woesearchaeota archaeon]
MQQRPDDSIFSGSVEDMVRDALGSYRVVDSWTNDLYPVPIHLSYEHESFLMLFSLWLGDEEDNDEEDILMQCMDLAAQIDYQFSQRFGFSMEPRDPLSAARPEVFRSRHELLCRINGPSWDERKHYLTHCLPKNGSLDPFTSYWACECDFMEERKSMGFFEAANRAAARAVSIVRFIFDNRDEYSFYFIDSPTKRMRLEFP